MIQPGDIDYVPAIYREFGSERFTLADLHCKVCRATNPIMRGDVEADYRLLMWRLEGFIEASPGPRGGEGYCLTTRGVSCAMRLQAKQQRSAA